MKHDQSDILLFNSENHADLVQETIGFWEQRSGIQVSGEEARQMIESIFGYFKLLSEWDSADKAGSDRKYD